MERKRKSTDDGDNKSGPSASSAWEPEKLPEPTNGKEEVVKKKKPAVKTTLSLFDDNEEEEGDLFGGGFSTTKSSSATKVPQCEEFQLDVQQYADLFKFAQVSSVNTTPCFVKTKFHQKFYEQICILRDFEAAFEDVYFSGIEGIGKTSTLIHYVLKCYKRKDYKVHYVDLAMIESEKELEEFIAYSKHFKDDDCLIIDHITVFNNNFVNKIKQTVKAKLRYILTEAGFTANVHLKLTFGKNWQLDEEDFEKIWVGTLKSAPKVVGTKVAVRCEKLIGRCKEVYAHFSNAGDLITPRLLNYVWRKMCNHNMILNEVSYRYETEKLAKIEDFVEIGDDSSMYKTFIAHTRYFLYHVVENADYILHPSNFRKLHLAVNVFDVEFQSVTEDNLKNDTRFYNLGFGEGDSYLRISHLIPKYAPFWREKLPYEFDLVYDESPYLLSIMFQNGGVRKEIERLLVKFQEEKEIAIIPPNFSETFYNVSSSECKIAQNKYVHYAEIHDDFFYIGLDELKQFESSVTDFRYHEKNVAKCAFWIKEKVMQGAFVFYPEIANLMGLDYFVFLPEHSANHSDVAQPKAPKSQKKLLMVQVAMGQNHGGDTIGRALNILKNILSNDILIHVVVLIASSKTDTYTLSKCDFSNLSVINIADTYMYKMIQKEEHMLHKYINKLLGN